MVIGSSLKYMAYLSENIGLNLEEISWILSGGLNSRLNKNKILQYIALGGCVCGVKRVLMLHA